MDLLKEEEIVPISLWETQVKHFQRISDILMKWHAYLDTSPMGSGKTIVTLAICAIFNLNLVVIGPLSTLSMWETSAKKHGIKLIYSMSYQKLSGTIKSGCNHPFINRVGDEFNPSDYLKICIQNKCLFVLFEAKL